MQSFFSIDPSDSKHTLTDNTEKEQSKTVLSQITQPYIPGQSRPTRTVHEGKRALQPSKAVIKYPKLKVRKPSPPSPSAPKPEITTTVVRGKDTLLISICKNPEKCVVEPDDIDSSVSPFQPVIALSVNRDLDDEVEAESKRSRLRSTPLNCFSPPKWTLLEEEPMNKPEKPSKGKSGPRSVEKGGYREGEAETQGESGAVKRKDGAEQNAVADGGLKESKAREASNKGQSKSKTDTQSDKKNEVDKKSKDIETKSTAGRVVQDEIQEKNVASQSTTTKKRSTRRASTKDDKKAKELIKKYLSISFSKDPAEHDDSAEELVEEEEEDEEKWPYLKPGINSENQATYVMLSKQLKDAQRLMDMPVRKREKRLWKGVFSRYNSRHNSREVSPVRSIF